MPIQRQFEPGPDVVRIRDFIARMVNREGQDRFMHIGDWLWQLHLREDRLPAARENLRIWTDDDGQILGFCWFQSGGMEIQVDPAASPAGEIEREMVAWAMSRQGTEADGSTSELSRTHLNTTIARSQSSPILVSRSPAKTATISFVKTCEHRQFDVTVPTGATVRAVDIDRDLEDRVAIHREVWHPSRFTAASYAAVRAAPGFVPELDLVAVAPDGTIAAYCICWYDPVNRIGEFEPVGARERFRRQGYGLALMHEGLRRLQDLGAMEAIVFSSATNAASHGLYSRSGFTVDGQYHTYARRAARTARILRSEVTPGAHRRRQRPERTGRPGFGGDALQRIPLYRRADLGSGWRLPALQRYP